MICYLAVCVICSVSPHFWFPVPSPFLFLSNTAYILSLQSFLPCLICENVLTIQSSCIVRWIWCGKQTELSMCIIISRMASRDILYTWGTTLQTMFCLTLTLPNQYIKTAKLQTALVKKKLQRNRQTKSNGQCSAGIKPY